MRHLSVFSSKASSCVDDREAPEIVNRWADTNTRGKIRRIVEEFDPEITMLLLNAIYFKGMWQDKFRHRINGRKAILSGSWWTQESPDDVTV